MGWIVFYNLLCLLSLLGLTWIISVWKRDAGIIDPIWGLGFVVVAWCTWFTSGFSESTIIHVRACILCLLVTLWGLRLFGYLLWRNLGEHEEDRRYAAMRAARGDAFWWKSLYVVFGLQAGLLWIISFPIQMAIATDVGDPLGILDFVGIALWAIGLFFESVGDWQLMKFKSDPNNKGKVLDRGLWRYTRHPNYFGDFCVTWGFYCFAVAAGAPWTVFGPLLMSFFLLKVSGVAMLERDIGQRRPAYREYIERTNAFFPGPRRSGG